MCCCVGGVWAWDAWLPATARLAAGVFAVATDLAFRVVPRRRMVRHDHWQCDGETGVGYLTTNVSNNTAKLIRPSSSARTYPAIL